MTKGERREQKRERSVAKRRRANNRKNLEVIIEAQRQRMRRNGYYGVDLATTLWYTKSIK